MPCSGCWWCPNHYNLPGITIPQLVQFNSIMEFIYPPINYNALIRVLVVSKSLQSPRNNNTPINSINSIMEFIYPPINYNALIRVLVVSKSLQSPRNNNTPINSINSLLDPHHKMEFIVSSN
jgi:hypothetical protein